MTVAQWITNIYPNIQLQLQQYEDLSTNNFIINNKHGRFILYVIYNIDVSYINNYIIYVYINLLFLYINYIDILKITMLYIII